LVLTAQTSPTEVAGQSWKPYRELPAGEPHLTDEDIPVATIIWQSQASRQSGSIRGKQTLHQAGSGGRGWGSISI